jgi:hypothetical protein
MSKALPLLVLRLCTSAFAQTRSDSFAYGAVNSQGNCSEITAWDAVPNAYPSDMGSVCFNYYPNAYSGMDIPFQLSYPNNGFLLDNTPFTFAPIVWTIGDGTHGGDTGTQAGIANYSGYGAGVTVNVNCTIVVHLQKRCPRYRHCYYAPVQSNTGGNGTVSMN